MTKEFQHFNYRITNDSGTQMAHVHFFSKVRGRVIHHNGLLAVFCHAHPRIMQCQFTLIRQPGIAEMHINKTGACHFQLTGNVIQVNKLNNFLRNVTGLLS